METIITTTPLPDIEFETSLTTIEEGQTIIRCMYTASAKYVNGGWITIWPTTYLVHPETNERLEMLFAYNIPSAPAKHYFKRVGEKHRFMLIFPRLSADWNSFHLLEIAGDKCGFVIRNIQREASGVYTVFIN